MWERKQKIGSTDQQPGDNLGISVAVSGSYMVSGAWWEEGEDGSNDPLTSAGAAYFYKLQADGTWIETQKVISPHRETLGYFGFIVAIGGNYAMIGAFNEDHSTGFNAGRVYAYHRNANDQWVLDDSLKIANPGNNDYFGASIAMAGDYALIGADGHGYDENGANFLMTAGAAFLFRKEPNNQWTQIRKFVPSDREAGDQFGKYLDIDDRGLVIGTFRKDGGIGFFEIGAAYAIGCDDISCDFDQITSADFQKLLSPDIDSYENFSWDVAISGDWLVAGKSSESNQPGGGTGSNTGAAYFFHWENGQWVGKQKVYAPDYSAFAHFGRSIAIDGSVCVIGAGTESKDENGQNIVAGAGAAYVFELQPNNHWLPVKKLVGTERGISDLFGEDALDISGINIVVGAWLADTISGDYKIDGGAVYFFQRDSPITAVNELFAVNDLSILNNPSLDGILRLHHLNQSNTNDISLNVFSVEGRLMASDQVSTSADLRIDLSNLPPAMYFVQLTSLGFEPQTLKWIRL